jgi:hypothetical protein
MKVKEFYLPFPEQLSDQNVVTYPPLNGTKKENSRKPQEDAKLIEAIEKHDKIGLQLLR